jgi:transposase
MVAAIRSGAAFARGRDFSAWMGLVFKQMSTGDRTILGHISKRGNGYLRTLFMQAARVILLRPASWPKHSNYYVHSQLPSPANSNQSRLNNEFLNNQKL